MGMSFLGHSPEESQIDLILEGIRVPVMGIGNYLNKCRLWKDIQPAKLPTNIQIERHNEFLKRRDPVRPCPDDGLSGNPYMEHLQIC